MFRAMRHVPASVGVINQHTEEIRVVVSKYHPNRQLKGGGLSASNTGMGFNYDTTVRHLPIPADGL